ncbi:MAG: hypothetical protein AAF085_02720 [Planctomycetota bacterium]
MVITAPRRFVSAFVTAGALVLLPAGKAEAVDFSYIDNGLPQTYIIPTTGLYEITAVGADCGAGNLGAIAGGTGATTVGTFQLNAGTQLDIVVAGVGLDGWSDRAGGGGGGSYVVLNIGDVPLVVAGGGGGGSNQSFEEGGGGLAFQTGGNTTDGGQSQGTQGGGGGGGFVGNGDNNIGTSLNAEGGSSYLNAALGGNGPGPGTTGQGGFGGGGGGYFSGGGGGGYFGGDSGELFDVVGGNGGGSFLAAEAIEPLSTAGLGGAGTGSNGSVSVVLVPEPSTLVPFAMCGLLVMRRRRG